MALYVACGVDPFELLRQGAEAVCRKITTAKLRRHKPVPDFADYFGWCTWDAFYRDVSAKNVQAGLVQFAKGGVRPRFMILDDGWQSMELEPTGEERLTDFRPNPKFDGELKSTVALAKSEFGMKFFLVWHTIVGYWGGVDAEKLPGYSVIDQARHFGEGIMAHKPRFNEDWWGSLVGFVSPDKISEFYEDFHRYLASQGVDGVKVDSQAVLEGISQGQGGRLRVTRAYREALEASAQRHFEGRLINCMSNGQETWYGSPSSTLIRSSIDFFPRLEESHGMHLYINAQVGLWFGEFMLPDWDMFQSGHVWGAYHAAARAISGGPVYVSDVPGQHDFDLLRKLVCSDGSVLRCDGPALPTLDSLCIDPTVDDALLKVWNTNGNAGIIGVFHAKSGGAGKPARRIAATFKPSDVPKLSEGTFACYEHATRHLTVLGATQERSLALGPKEFELVTIVPLENGFAPIGLTDKFNSAGAVSSTKWRSPRVCELSLKDSGQFLAFAKTRPASVRVDGNSSQFDHNTTTGTLGLTITGPAAHRVTVNW